MLPAPWTSGDEELHVDDDHVEAVDDQVEEGGAAHVGRRILGIVQQGPEILMLHIWEWV